MKQTSPWTAIRKELVTLDTAMLVRLVKDLYDASPANRDFLAARFVTGDASGGTPPPIESFRRRIKAVFNIRDAKLDLAGGRKAIREYRKATDDLAGTVYLMLTYLEEGTWFTREFGDIDERFYDSLCSVLEELKTLLLGPAAEHYAAVASRLADLEHAAGSIGWGYGDFVGDVVGELARGP